MEHYQHQSSKHIPMSETILETIRTLNAQSNKYITSQKEVAFSYALDAKNLATSYLSQLGTNSELPISTSIDDESFVISVKKELVNALSTLVLIYNTSGEVDNSKELIILGIPLAEECKMEFHHAQFLLNFGNCFFRTSFMMEALENYEQSLEKLEYLNTKESILLKSKVLNNIGNVYNKLNDNSAS
jgi:tetratricopeptide (TPR) repeat protein